MRNFRQLCAATFLTLIITVSAFAGDMQTPGIITQPTQQTSATGDIQTPGASVTGQTDTTFISDAYPVSEIAMTLMLNVMSVF